MTSTVCLVLMGILARSHVSLPDLIKRKPCPNFIPDSVFSVFLQGTSLGHEDGDNGGKKSKNVLDFIPTSTDHDTSYGCRATNLAIQESIHDAITLNVKCKAFVFTVVLNKTVL